MYILILCAKYSQQKNLHFFNYKINKKDRIVILLWFFFKALCFNKKKTQDKNTINSYQLSNREVILV